MGNSNSLVLDGGEVKFRLEAERLNTGSMVHIDWLRFTVIRRNHVPDFSSRRSLAGGSSQFLEFSSNAGKAFAELPEVLRVQRVKAELQKHKFVNPDADEFDAVCQALELARECATALGADFRVGDEIKKGIDFYKYRWSIERQGFECGWVGFCASSDSPRQQAQSLTIHANLFGHAMTFADAGARERLADIVSLHDAKITRVDLALDFFGGMRQSLPELLQGYREGLFDVRGKRPASKVAGDWGNDAERSLYIGCRKSGKETNIYEKGDQLFGREAKNPWVRVELRYGNKLRVLPVDVLTRPSDFFAGASDWHCDVLNTVKAVQAVQSCPQVRPLPAQTVSAEVHRNLRWALTSAAATVSAAFRFLPVSEFLELVNWETKKLPWRLRKFKESDLSEAFKNAMGNFSPAAASGQCLAMQ